MMLLTTADAARALRLSAERVRQLERAGVLRAYRTVGGLRIYLASDVERLAAERAARRGRAQA